MMVGRREGVVLDRGATGSKGRRGECPATRNHTHTHAQAARPPGATRATSRGRRQLHARHGTLLHGTIPFPLTACRTVRSSTPVQYSRAPCASSPSYPGHSIAYTHSVPLYCSSTLRRYPKATVSGSEAWRSRSLYFYLLPCSAPAMPPSPAASSSKASEVPTPPRPSRGVKRRLPPDLTPLVERTLPFKSPANGSPRDSRRGSASTNGIASASSGAQSAAVSVSPDKRNRKRGSRVVSGSGNGTEVPSEEPEAALDESQKRTADLFNGWREEYFESEYIHCFPAIMSVCVPLADTLPYPTWLPKLSNNYH